MVAKAKKSLAATSVLVSPATKRVHLQPLRVHLQPKFVATKSTRKR